MQSNIGVLLHPRLPPLVRSMPHVESLALFKAEESQEEAEALSALGVESIHSKGTCDQDVEMKDCQLMVVPIAQIPSHAAPSVPESPPIAQSSLPRPQPIDDERGAIQPLPQPTTIKVKGTAADPPSQPTTSFPSTSHRPTAATVSSVPIPIPAQEDDDEEMPIINMDSDSDEEED